jgi:hypothetical protein
MGDNYLYLGGWLVVYIGQERVKTKIMSLVETYCQYSVTQKEDHAKSNGQVMP